MDLKLKDSDTIVDSKEFENVMKALHSIARPIAKTRYEEESLPAQALKQIVAQANNPKSGLISGEMIEALSKLEYPIGSKSKRYISGTQVVDTLFEDSWKEKLEANPEATIHLKNDGVRAIIKASQPKISITFDQPLDLEHSTTKHYEAAVHRRFNNRLIQLLEVSEDINVFQGGDGITWAVNQASKEEGWRRFVRDRFAQEIGVPSISRGV